MSEELDQKGGLWEQLSTAERNHDYPEVTKLCRVIDVDTGVVVVDPRLLTLLEGYRRPSPRVLQNRSIQLWSSKINDLGLEPIHPSKDLFAWRDRYDPLFLGVMAGMLRTAAAQSGLAIV
jgi:hypothetical protein